MNYFKMINYCFLAVIGAIVSAATSGRSHGGGIGGHGHGHASYAAPTRTKTIILKKGTQFGAFNLKFYHSIRH